MKDVPLDAQVECTDGPCGKSVTIIINPTTRKLTHFVVKDTEKVERLVPVEQVEATTRDQIQLRCTQAELSAMERFIGSRYIEVTADMTAGSSYMGASFAYQAPYVTHKYDQVTIDEERIPEGEIALHRGATVEAADGHVGKVGELVIDPGSGEISHLILMKGHLWGKKEISVPVSAIEFASEDTVYLKLDKRAIGQLPAVPVKRH